MYLLTAIVKHVTEDNQLRIYLCKSHKTDKLETDLLSKFFCGFWIQIIL